MTFYEDWNDVLDFGTNFSGSQTTTSFTLVDTDGTHTVFHGTGFTYDAGNANALTGGTITSMERTTGSGTLLMQSTGMNKPISDILSAQTSMDDLRAEISWIGVVSPPASEADWIVERSDTFIKLLNSDGTLTVLNVPTGGIAASEEAFTTAQVGSIEHQNADGSTASATVTGVNLVGFTVLGALYTFFQPIVLNQEMFAGDDTISIVSGEYDEVNGFLGNDTINGSVSNDDLEGSFGNDTLNGNDGNDYLGGKDGDDVLNGGAGQDHLAAGAGDDTLTGGSDFDYFEFRADDGNWGHDMITDFDAASGEKVSITQTATIKGYLDLVFTTNGSGDAVASAGGNSITFQGLSIADLSPANFEFPIYGDNNDNILVSGTGGDSIFGDAGNDSMYGYGGNDHMRGSDGDDLLKGGDGDDTMYGDDDGYEETPGADTLFGGNGNDTMHGDGGNDYLYGENGNDFMFGNDGDDRLVGGAGDDTMNGNDGDDTLKGKDGMDTISGDLGVDILFGDYGNDTLNGGSGNDFLYGGRDSDVLNGDDGDDRLRGNRNDDTLNGGQGDDRLYGGSNADTLNGDNGNDFLVGENHADILDGGAGDDVLYGNLAGGAADGDADLFLFKAGNEIDRVRDFEDGIDHIDLSAFGYASKADAMSHATQTGWGTVKFDMGGGDIMYVEHMTLGTDFTDDDIIV